MNNRDIESLVGGGKIDTTVAHPARRYDYLLGGKDNFAVDRESGDALVAAFPHIRAAARSNRDFLRRAVTFLTVEAGIRQFLDIGTGLPTANNTHEVAQSFAPQARIAYVDNDPLVLTHARALLTSASEGATSYTHADLRDPRAILSHPEVTNVIDFTRPVALLLVSVLAFLPDDDDPWTVVATLMDGLPSGSYLALSHAATDHFDPQVLAAWYRAAPDSRLRSGLEIARFFSGLQIVAPGLVSTADWRPDDRGERLTPEQAVTVAGVAGKP